MNFVEHDLGIRAGGTKNAAGTTGRETFDGASNDSRNTGRIEREVEPVAGDPDDLLYDVALAGIDRMGRAEFSGKNEPLVAHVDCDDGGRADDLGSHHGRKAHRAGSEDREGFSV